MLVEVVQLVQGVCAVKAIEGNIKEKHFIDPEKCVRCGACISACGFGAIIKL